MITNDQTFIESAWIPHDGGPCPIPWAKEGEWEWRLGCNTSKAGHIALLDALEDQNWQHQNFHRRITSYRLTHGWIKVVDEKILVAVNAGDEKRFRNREIDTFMWDHEPGLVARDIVAVRHTKPREITTQEDKILNDALKASVKIIKQPKIHISKEGLAIAWSEKDCAYMPVAKYQLVTVKETEKQRLTREVSTAYFAKLHAKQEPVRLLTDDGITAIAAAALVEHDKVWPRKI